jgi:nicotinamide riboside transporter PnuC
MNRIYIFALMLASIFHFNQDTFAQIDTTIVIDLLIEKTKIIDTSNIDNNTKENIKQENISKMKTSDWIAGISVLIALAALIISIITSVKTNNLANKDYLLTHRPFVWVENFGYLNNQNIIVNPLNQVMIRVLNSPANFIKEYFEYYIIDNEGNKIILEKRNIIIK